MTARGNQTIAWDVENRPTSITGGASFVYDGDGARVKKTENNETILYVNRYYEKNLTTNVVTTSYFLGGRLVAQREGTTLRYVHRDSLSSTMIMTDTNGNVVDSIKYYPYGGTRSGSVPTDYKFTGQRLDGTGLYYYGARYYDAGIGRFISADPVVQTMMNPQALNRYSYVWGNPLRYVDPSGLCVRFQGYSGCYQEPDWSLMQDDDWRPPEEMLAWELMRMSTPEAAEIATKLENSEGIVWVGWSDSWPMEGTNITLGGEMFPLGRHSQYIYVQGDLRGDPAHAAAKFGHEAVHAVEGRQVDSVLEEVRAYQMEYRIANALSVQNDITVQENWGWLDPSTKLTDRVLGNAKRDIVDVVSGNAKAIYESLPKRPSRTWNPQYTFRLFRQAWAALR